MKAKSSGWLLAGVACALGPVTGTPAARAQTATDGAIAGQVLDTAGAPVAGALVEARELDTGLVLRSLSGTRGEFLVVRLPVGEYEVTVEDAGAMLTLPGQVAVGLGEVTEITARLRAAAAGQPNPPAGTSGGGAVLSEADLDALPVGDGAWSSLALTVPGANGAAAEDDGAGAVSFAGVATSQNRTRLDGASGDESFAGARVGAGVEEDGDAGADEVYDRAAGAGSGSNSVADGGRRAGSAYAFSQAAVREFRVQGLGDAAEYGSALYGHGIGGVVTTVSRSGGATLHGMAFYTVRDSAWAAVNPFSVASTYANGVVTTALVKPQDLLQLFGGRVGGPLLEHSVDRGGGMGAVSRLFYFYAFDGQRRNFPAISSPGYAGFYALTATQEALLANRGVSPAQTMAALN